MELIAASRLAVDKLIDVLGRASIEAVLQLSAAGLAGKKHQGRKGGDMRGHGAQSGQVSLLDRKLRVKKPRLRRRGRRPGREVDIPASAAMKTGPGSRLLSILMPSPRSLLGCSIRSVFPDFLSQGSRCSRPFTPPWGLS